MKHNEFKADCSDVKPVESSQIENELNLEKSYARVFYTGDSLVNANILSFSPSNIEDKLHANEANMQDMLDQDFLFKFKSSEEILAYFKDSCGIDLINTDAANKTLSVSDFIKNVEQVTVKYVHLMLDLSKQSRDSMGKIAHMTEELTQVIGLVDDLSYHAAETMLVSINTLIDAAQFGDSGKNYAFVAEHVKKIAAHAKRFGSEIQLEMGTILDAIKTTEGVVESVSKSGAKTIFSMQSSIDQLIGQLRESLGWLEQLGVAERVGQPLEGEDGPRPGLDFELAFSRVQDNIYELQGLLAILLLKMSLLQQLEIFSSQGQSSINTLNISLRDLLTAKIVD